MIEVAVYAAEGSGVGLIQFGPDVHGPDWTGDLERFCRSDAAALAEAFWQLLPSATFDALVAAMLAKQAVARSTWAS